MLLLDSCKALFFQVVFLDRKILPRGILWHLLGQDIDDPVWRTQQLFDLVISNR